MGRARPSASQAARIRDDRPPSAHTNRSVAATGCPEIGVCSALFYEAQVDNGGHIQFVRNTNDAIDAYRAAASGLMHVGARRHLSIVLDLVERWNGNAALMNGMVDRPDPYRGPHRPFFDRCDGAFFAEDETPVSRLAADWIGSAMHVARVPIEDSLGYKTGARVYTVYSRG
ncbi:DUF4375 domain-containing protein [Methylobacterium sp. ap11]|uniref:DMP19 family protein n=1 Tax=Methylobacterium sp. ap11 TaxID=1761799 RepID=UPI0015A72DF2|nr:DUF4375 domain-containing protein [Methylobacterium sp. ap11]